MQITNELLKKFFQDKCSAEEVEVILAYLNENPSVLYNYINEIEWQNFEINSKLHPAISEKILAVVKNEIHVPNKSKRTWLRYVAAAAAVIGIFFSVNYFITTQQTKNNTLTTNSVLAEKPILKVINNTSKIIEKITLEDGSSIELSPNSQLSFYKPFEQNKRSIYLKGLAKFTVAKNASKPFTVYSNEISTTALGTQFSVSDFEKLNTIVVSLFEGKVVVKSNNSKLAIKDVYMNAGDVFEYNKISGLVKNSQLNIGVVKVKSKSNNTPTTVENNNWYMFNNQNLAAVFDQLSAIYNVTIHYTKTDLSKMNFIGKVDKTDLIDNVLQDIALLNNLSVKKEGTQYFITKK